ncbi:lysine acetyltransferase protein [Stemphylium lycopersici]|nr:lysine acetyltransferase protein [Stemphylium lycopersici]RAR04863.1 lysine acetyltransferase protein [Stemphylium lycopersici]
MIPTVQNELPPSNSLSLVLRHPTPEECRAISKSTFSTWADSLTPTLYLEESRYLTTIPLAKDGGMTSWVLVHKDQAEGERDILCSCETFRKRCLVSDARGSVQERVVHGIASVFCAPSYRGMGYASRMMRELVKELYTWQAGNEPCVGSTLYSDIGKKYYAKLGWSPNTANSHVELRPADIAWPSLATPVTEDKIEALCRRDEVLVRARMALPTEEAETRFTIMPDHDHILWHLAKETFACKHIFDKVPTLKGAIAGAPGNQVWALWTHRYYSHPFTSSSDNKNSKILYILRLALETDETATCLPSSATKYPTGDILDQQAQSLKAVLQAAQAEAKEWNLDAVQLWNPTPLVQHLICQIEIQHELVEREEDGIASLLWYDGQGGNSQKHPVWVNNEYYAWQ